VRVCALATPFTDATADYGVAEGVGLSDAVAEGCAVAEGVGLGVAMAEGCAGAAGARVGAAVAAGYVVAMAVGLGDAVLGDVVLGDAVRVGGTVSVGGFFCWVLEEAAEMVKTRKLTRPLRVNPTRGIRSWAVSLCPRRTTSQRMAPTTPHRLRPSTTAKIRTTMCSIFCTPSDGKARG
jgi:hypothetical protein